MVEKLKVAAAIVKETFAHPLTKSVIYVDNGQVRVEHPNDKGQTPGGQSSTHQTQAVAAGR